MFVKKTMDELERLPAVASLNASKFPCIIILDDVRSMHNVGSVFRTCDAFAAQAIYLCGYTPVPPHRDIHKTALGATETVFWKQFKNIQDAILELKNTGYIIYCIEQVHGSKPLNELKIKKDEKIALVFGNEVTGISEIALQCADGCIEIPQWGAKHSLNISVSVGIVLWELIRE